jgi:WD40 repeat protein
VLRLSDRREFWRRDKVEPASLSPDGRYVAAIKPDGTLVVWELPAGKKVWRQTGIPAKITVKNDDDDDVLVPNVQRIAFGARGDRVALDFKKAASRAWELPGGRELAKDEAASLAEPGAGLSYATAVSADGRWKAETNGPEIMITDIHANREVAKATHDADPDADGNVLEDLEFSGDGQHLLTGSRDKTVRI